MEANFAINVRADGRTVVLEVVGELDMNTVAMLDDQVDKGLESEPATLVIDLAEVSFLSSMGIACLIRAHQLADENTTVRVVTGRAHTAKVLTMTGLDQVLAVYSSREEALAARTVDVS